MKLNIIALSLILCGCSKAQDLTAVSNSYWGVTEAAFKAGVATGYAYTTMDVSTNSRAPDGTNKCYLLTLEAWHDFTNSVGQKHTRDIALISVMTAHPQTNYPVTIHWQYQEVRDVREKYFRQLKEADSFNKTNKNRGVAYVLEMPNMDWSHQLTTNDVELGFCSDHKVIWRVPPEAQ